MRYSFSAPLFFSGVYRKKINQIFTRRIFRGSLSVDGANTKHWTGTPSVASWRVPFPRMDDIIWTALICKMVDPVSWEVVSEMEHVPFSLHFLVFTLICPRWRTTKSHLLEARIPSVHYPITMIFLKPDGQMGVDPMLLLCCHSRRWHVSKQTRLLLSFHRFSNGLSSAWFHSPLI